MNLSDSAKPMGVRYETAWRWSRDGTIQGRAVEVVHQAENGTEDVLADLTAIGSSLCARLHGQWRAKRKTEVIVRELEAQGEVDVPR